MMLYVQATVINSSDPYYFEQSSTPIQQFSIIVGIASAVICLLGVLASQGILPLPVSIAWMITGGVGVIGGALSAYLYRSKQPEYLGTILKGEAHSLLGNEVIRGIHFAEKSDALSDLGECSCQQSNRKNIPGVRETFENQIVSSFEEIASNKDRLNLTFSASGYLFGEFVILAKLFSKLRELNWKGGIEVNIIDIQYISYAQQSKIDRAIQAFERELRHNLDPSIPLNVQVYGDHTDFMNYVAFDENNRADCLVAIEDTCGDAFIASGVLYQTTLSNEGIYANFRKMRLCDDREINRLQFYEGRKLKIQDFQGGRQVNEETHDVRPNHVH